MNGLRRRTDLERVTVTQDGRLVTVDVVARPGVSVHSLWANGTGGEWSKQADFAAIDGGRRAVVDLAALAADAGAAGPAVFQVSGERIGAAGTEAFRVPLGGAPSTTISALSPIVERGRTVRPFVTDDGELAVSIDTELRVPGEIWISRINVRHGVLTLRGWLARWQAEVHTDQVDVQLKGRVTDTRILTRAHVQFDERRTARDGGRRWYRIAVDLDFATALADGVVVDDTYDAWMEVAQVGHAEPALVRVGRTRYVTRRLTNTGWAERAGRGVTITPYFTRKAKRLSVELNVFAADDLRYLRRELRRQRLPRPPARGRDVWLVGERPTKAQDTGYHFFKHLRLNHPDVEAYYVIDRDSPERANVEPLGNVVDFKSKEHIRASLRATKIVGSHHPDFLFPLRTKQFERRVRAATVFLQHGVIGAKWMANTYGHNAGFNPDLFVVSSEREKQIIATDFAFDRDRIAVTGLSRFDALFADDVEVNHRQVLIMPTWRPWLLDLDSYPESEFHQTWSALLHHPQLKEMVERDGLEIVFCLHPNMQQFRALFEDSPARVISQGDVDVQFLLKQSALLITDYSSVGWDFSFLHKPVVYCQFDQERFPAPHIDPVDELPGPIVRSVAALLAEIDTLAAEDMVMAAEYRRRADRFIDHHDRDNSERIYQRALTTRRHRDLRARVLSSDVLVHGTRYLRRNRYYFPAMIRAFRLVRRFPAAKDMVVFESGMGKQYGDSPRYIYEELVRRGANLRMVWVYPTALPNHVAQVPTIKRNSPRYFYYLARAKYWVNNQSFTYYFTRRPDGVFLQTWHGTPLKRMLHDMDEVHGRDGGYLKRASTGAQQWSVLLSPSDYTTEAMRTAFRYQGPVLELGYPRNDILYAPDRDEFAARLRQRLGIRGDQRVVLYAPTFRDNQTARPGEFTFALPFDLEAWCRALGEDTVLLLRMHVHIKNRIEIPTHLRHLVHDVSSYPDIQELYLASDMLITDYSSVFFDYAVLRRPILFYAPDLELYRDTLRGFYLDYDKDLPGPIVTTEAELFDAVREPDASQAPFLRDRDSFLARFAPNDDGHAAERVVDAIFGDVVGSESPSVPMGPPGPVR